VLYPYWSEVLLPEQGFLENPKHITKIFDLIPFEDSVRNDFLRKWKPQKAKGESLSASRWKELEKKINTEATRLTKTNKAAASALRRAALEVVFVYCYPRLDVEVSKHMNHLLKAPFCVHPKTGRVCVPIDPATCETFDAFAVPTVAQLLNQVRVGCETSWEDSRSSLLTRSNSCARVGTCPDKARLGMLMHLVVVRRSTR
jgi:DNA primase small subunit